MVRTILMITAGLAFVIFVVFGVTTCGILKITEDFFTELEPEMKQYVQMTMQEQNEYVEKHLDEILRKIDTYTEATEKENWETVMKDPQVNEVGLRLGRALCATTIVGLDSIRATLTPEQIETYQKEADSLQEVGDEFKNVLEKYTDKNEKKIR